MPSKTFPRAGIITLALFFFGPLVAPSRAYSLSPPSPLLSITQWYRYPPEYTDVRFSLNSPLLYGNLILRDPDDLDTVDPEVRTWNIRIKPLRYIALFGGSITGTGIPARARNPIAPCNAPVFRPVRPTGGMILRPGTSLETEYVGAEIGPPAFRLALVAAPDEASDKPGWGCVSSTIPNLFPGGFGYSVSLYAGLRKIGPQEDTSWFMYSPYVPAAHLLYPAAEFILFNRFVSASCSAFGNITELRETRGACHADLGITWKFLSLGGAWYRADRGFMDFAGSVDTIMERKLVAPGLLIPFPGSNRFKFQLNFIAAEDLLLTKEFNAADSVRRYYGLQAVFGDSSCRLKASVEKENEGITIAGSVRAYRLFHPSIQLEISGMGYIPESAGDIGMMENTKFESALAWRSADRFRLELAGVRKQDKIDVPPEYQATLLGSGTLFTGRYLSVYISVELSRGSAPETDYASLYLKTAFNR